MVTALRDKLGAAIRKGLLIALLVLVAIGCVPPILPVCGGVATTDPDGNPICAGLPSPNTETPRPSGG